MNATITKKKTIKQKAEEYAFKNMWYLPMSYNTKWTVEAAMKQAFQAGYKRALRDKRKDS